MWDTINLQTINKLAYNQHPSKAHKGSICQDTVADNTHKLVLLNVCRIQTLTIEFLSELSICKLAGRCKVNMNLRDSLYKQ